MGKRLQGCGPLPRNALSDEAGGNPPSISRHWGLVFCSGLGLGTLPPETEPGPEPRGPVSGGSMLSLHKRSHYRAESAASRLVSLVVLHLSPRRAWSGADEQEFLRAMLLPSSDRLRQGHRWEVDSEKKGSYTAPPQDGSYFR